MKGRQKWIERGKESNEGGGEKKRRDVKREARTTDIQNERSKTVERET